MPDDKIQREIEEILNRLDTFVPEETVASRMRRRSSEAAGSFIRVLLSPFLGISLRQVMFAALAIVIVAFFGRKFLPMFASWALVAGLILFFTSLALSFFSKGPPTVEKHWRGRPIELEEPGWPDRLRDWLKGKHRRER